MLAALPDGPAVLNTLILMSGTLPAAPGADRAALLKSDDLANRALAIMAMLDGKTLGMSDTDWAKQRTLIEGTLQTTLGGNAYTRGEYDKAVEHLTIATKDDPKNGLAWYQMGAAIGQQAAALSKKVQDGNAAANKAIAAKADRGDIDEMKATNEALAEAFRAKAQEAMDAYATAVACGGPPADPAHAQLQKMWSQAHNGSTDGMEDFIKSKKPQN